MPEALALGAAALGAVATLVLDVAPMVRASSTDAYETDHEPRAAATYAAGHLLGARIYSTYEWGGYLAWRFGDQRMVWLYGESGIFGDQRLKDYLHVHLLQPGWRDVLTRAGMDHAIVPTDSQETAA